MDFTFLKTFYTGVVAETFDAPTKHAILSLWIKLYKERALAADDAVNALRLLVKPLVAHSVTHGQAAELLTPEVVRSLVADVFQNPDDGALRCARCAGVCMLRGNVMWCAEMGDGS